MQLNTDFVLDAINTVLDWDMPDDACGDAVATQTCLMSGLESEHLWEHDTDLAVH